MLHPGSTLGAKRSYKEHLAFEAKPPDRQPIQSTLSLRSFAFTIELYWSEDPNKIEEFAVPSWTGELRQKTLNTVGCNLWGLGAQPSWVAALLNEQDEITEQVVSRLWLRIWVSRRTARGLRTILLYTGHVEEKADVHGADVGSIAFSEDFVELADPFDAVAAGPDDPGVVTIPVIRPWLFADNGDFDDIFRFGHKGRDDDALVEMKAEEIASLLDTMLPW